MENFIQSFIFFIFFGIIVTSQVTFLPQNVIKTSLAFTFSLIPLTLALSPSGEGCMGEM
jgi:hypothetical protein